MADLTFNVALGREVELYNRVDTNDPANSALIMVVLASTGLVDDGTLKDYDDLAAILAGASDEVTNSGYARKTLTDANLAAFTIDDTRDRILLVLPVQTFTSIVAGSSWSKLLVCYDPDTTGGTDSSVIPITAHDLRYNNAALIPNGSNIVVDLSAGFCVCQ